MKESDVFALGRGCRAERPAIDPGRRDGDEQAAIEPMVSRFNRAVAGVVVHVHAPMIAHAATAVSRFSDLNGKPATPARIATAMPAAPAARGFAPG
ncbi:MAG TPA: hypothetical protein VND19_22825 [Acetobacteraceae bacterium]|nr:hypothetical protein [Acetobacteraceae bacterium]